MLSLFLFPSLLYSVLFHRSSSYRTNAMVVHFTVSLGAVRPISKPRVGRGVAVLCYTAHTRKRK